MYLMAVTFVSTYLPNAVTVTIYKQTNFFGYTDIVYAVSIST